MADHDWKRVTLSQQRSPVIRHYSPYLSANVTYYDYACTRCGQLRSKWGKMPCDEAVLTQVMDS